MGGAPKEDNDLMSRILAAELGMDGDEGVEDAPLSHTRAPVAAAPTVKPAAAPIPEPGPCAGDLEENEDVVHTPQKLQLSKPGVLGLRVWAIVGDPEVVEDIIDHLMDCGKTVFNVAGAGGGAYFTSVADLERDPNLPKAEVLALVEKNEKVVQDAIDQAVAMGLRGAVLHPSTSAFGGKAAGEAMLEYCRKAGLAAHEADLLADAKPGAGIGVAPLD